jgi:opacity protein-like surface antigen
MKRILLAGTALALCLGLAQAQSDNTIVKRNTELREAPGDQSRSLGPLAAKAPLTRLPQRQGAWIQVRTEKGAIGWLHMFDITTVGSASASSGGGSNVLRGFTGLFGGGSTQPRNSGTTATIGIRGLDSEDIANAQPNPRAVAQVEALRVDEQQAKAFGLQAQLVTRNVEALPTAAKPRTDSGNSSNSRNSNTER